MDQVTKMRLSCYLVLLSADSKTRQQDSCTFMTWPRCIYIYIIYWLWNDASSWTLSLLEDSDYFFPAKSFNGYWWPGDARNRGKISHCNVARLCPWTKLNWPAAMMMSSNGSIFHVTGLLCREFVNSPHKGQWCGVQMLMIWDAIWDAIMLIMISP